MSKHAFLLASLDLLLGSKGQLISKADLKIFIWTKNQQKYFGISALSSLKKGQ